MTTFAHCTTRFQVTLRSWETGELRIEIVPYSTRGQDLIDIVQYFTDHRPKDLLLGVTPLGEV